MASNRTDSITRRGFRELTSAALVSTSLLTNSNAAEREPGLENAPVPDASASASRIALEEHFAIPETFDSSYAVKDLPSPEARDKLLDVGAARVAEMDRGGVEIAILSLVAPGIQGIANVKQAVDTAQRANDYLAEHIAKNSKRLKGFAALPLQDPQAAAQELTRCIKELGFAGTLVNGFSQIGEADSTVYYDLPQYRPFWATVQELDVPFYLHPRAPLPTHQQAYEGHAWLVGSTWGFAVETSIHALRLMGSGLFDEYPKLKVILGHLGEAIPFNIWRVDHRLKMGTLAPKPQSKLPIGHYLRENFYITTSGNFRTHALTDVIAEMGSSRVLYSVDYPLEDMIEAKQWFDDANISESDRMKIGRTNAQKLFRF
jgi:2,3-dihydroxybenzoate decarboxylase